MRTYKKDSTGVREYFFDGGVRVLMEFNKKGKIKAKYTLGPGMDEIISKTGDNKTYYYHYDGLGSVTELTDESGEVVERCRYKPFGQLKEGGGSNSFAFTGREYDQDSGLYYYRVRYYNGANGRFLQRDPIGLLGGNNLYLYCNNNPVNWVDPWGFGPLAPGECCIGDSIGKWRCVKWWRTFNIFCMCYWICDIPEGIIWSGNIHALPTTKGIIFYDPTMGGEIKRGNNCACGFPQNPRAMENR